MVSRIISLLSFIQPPIVKACFHGKADDIQTYVNRGESVNYQVSGYLVKD